MTEPRRNYLQAFASLAWYEATIKFIFNFVTKTSELLLAAGIVMSTANFLTDGDVMSHNKTLSDSWSWAQALAIDSSLGIVFVNGFQAVRARDAIKAAIFFTLTALLATVAGLITHFDALGHAAGLPVTDKGISGIIPLWIMTALRAIAVIGFLLASRLKDFSFNELRSTSAPSAAPVQSVVAPRQEPAAPQIDYDALAAALIRAIQRAGAILGITLVEEASTALPAPMIEATDIQEPEPQSEEKHRQTTQQEMASATDECQSASDLQTNEEERATPKEPESSEEPQAPEPQEPADQTSAERDARIELAYRELKAEGERISGRALAKRAHVHRTVCNRWLESHQKEGTEP
jgi:hypothetical protein